MGDRASELAEAVRRIDHAVGAWADGGSSWTGPIRIADLRLLLAAVEQGAAMREALEKVGSLLIKKVDGFTILRSPNYHELASVVEDALRVALKETSDA